MTATANPPRRASPAPRDRLAPGERSGRRRLIEAKLVIPNSARATVPRARLLRRLDGAAEQRIISVVAPPGYGKTATLAQWASASLPNVAWLTVDEGDNDPVVFLSYLAAAIGRIKPLDAGVYRAIAMPASSPRAVVGQLLSFLAQLGPVVLVIDDAQRITNRTVLDALSEFVSYLPPLCRFATISRDPIDLPLARWRSRGVLLELGPADLAMDEDEARSLTRQFGLELPLGDVKLLTQRTEGWPALLTLTAATARRSGVIGLADTSVLSLSIADYLRSELLEDRSAEELSFLMRTSILERLTGPACDAILARHDSTVRLANLARRTILIDEYGGSFRYHAVLREFLRNELAMREPGMTRRLHRRAAAWYEAAGDVDQAVDHAFAAKDLDEAARLVGYGFIRYHWSARRATTRAWVDRFGTDALLERPWLAVLGAWEELASGDVAATERLADIADRGAFMTSPPDGTASFESGRAMLRASMCRIDTEAMLADATLAVDQETAADSRWRDFALWTQAIARQAAGDSPGAEKAIAAAIEAARGLDNDGLAYCLLGHRALIAIDRQDWASAEQLMGEARSRNAAAQVDGYLSSVPAAVARIRIAIHHGQLEIARRELARSAILRPLLTAAAPAFSVVALLGFVRAYVGVGDVAAAHVVMTQAKAILDARPALKVLRAEFESLAATVATLPVGPAGASSLTAAELRVLALLPYYLSFKEVGERLGVRATTVKTQALSIYGKLGATSRGEAVELAVEAGLLERFPV